MTDKQEQITFDTNYAAHYREKLAVRNLIERSGWGPDNEVGVFHLVVQIARELRLGPKDQLADIGCGVGIFSLLLSPMVAGVQAGDYLPEVCASAAENTQGIANIAISPMDLLKAASLPRGCNKILVNSVLQTLPDDSHMAAAIDNLGSAAAPGTLCLLACNADRGQKEEYIAGIERLNFPEERKARMRAIHRAAPWVDRDVVASAAERAGFKVVAMSSPPEKLWQSWYMFHALLEKA